MSATNENIAYQLRSLVEQLRARYPGVSVIVAKLEEHGNGIQQTIRYSAPIELLRKCGLVTDAMMEHSTDGRRGRTNTSIGDGYSLFDHSTHSLSEPGDWDLSIHTGAVPRERERISVCEAQRQLKRFRIAGK